MILIKFQEKNESQLPRFGGIWIYLPAAGLRRQFLWRVVSSEVPSSQRPLAPPVSHAHQVQGGLKDLGQEAEVEDQEDLLLSCEV